MDNLIGLYKAKRKDDGKWVKGYLVKYGSGDYVIYGEILKKLDHETYKCFSIDKILPETICEYINTSDNEKSLVFTNDIVEFSYCDEFNDEREYIGFIYKGDGCYKIATMNNIFYIDSDIKIKKVIGDKFDSFKLLMN